MNSKFLHFLFVLACAALIGLGPVRGARAQNSTGNSDANGSVVTAPARHSDASHSAVSPSSPDANAARTKDTGRTSDAAATDIANDRGTVAPNEASRSHFNAGWIGLIGLLGLLGLVRGRRAESRRRDRAEEGDLRRPDLPRAA